MRAVDPFQLSMTRLGEFGENMRAADVNECKAAGWRDPLAAVLEALHWSGSRSWALVDGTGRVWVLAGLAESSDVENDILLQPWFVAREGLRPRDLVRAGKVIYSLMECHRHNSAGERRVFWNTVWNKAVQSHTFIEHFGFRLDRRPKSILRHPKTGEFFYPFES
jgi:hypothetical protein